MKQILRMEAATQKGDKRMVRSLNALRTSDGGILRFGKKSQNVFIGFCDAESNRKFAQKSFCNSVSNRRIHFPQCGDPISKRKKDSLHVASHFIAAHCIPPFAIRASTA
jgi:hypothetical protein